MKPPFPPRGTPDPRTFAFRERGRVAGLWAFWLLVAASILSSGLLIALIAAEQPLALLACASSAAVSAAGLILIQAGRVP